MLRDSSGKWVKGFCRRLGTSNPLLAELWAIRVAVETLRDGNYSKVVVESESKEAIASVKDPGGLVNPYLELVGAIRRAIPAPMEVHFNHVLREANIVADCLAKSAHVFGFGTQVLHFPTLECRSFLSQDTEEALASLQAHVG